MELFGVIGTNTNDVMIIKFVLGWFKKTDNMILDLGDVFYCEWDR